MVKEELSHHDLLQIQKGIKSLHHRGPDDAGFWKDLSSGYELGLGHTRLSIIDLSHGGHQPWISKDNRLALTFNGEIYNYRELRAELEDHGYAFQTESDTEVLGRAWEMWGVLALRKIVGMFAFAMFDRRRMELVCARDAFGIKPLYFSSQRDGFYFASELPTLAELLARKLNINEVSTYEYLLSGKYEDGQHTFYKEIYRIEPGHLITLDLKSDHLLPISQRWWWPEECGTSPLSLADAVEKVRETFLSSVRAHLVSDVPVGIALSGGLDSSSIACAVRHLDPQFPITTFSYVARGTNVSEEPWIDLVNQYLGAESYKIEIGPGDLVADLDALIRAQGEPFASTSLYAQFRVYKAASEAGYRVILDGQGADEIFAGYDGYPDAMLRTVARSGGLLQSLAFLLHWSAYPGRSRLRAFRLLLDEYLPTKVAGVIAREIERRRGEPFLNSVMDVDLPQWPVAGLPSDHTFENMAPLSHRLRSAVTGGDLSSLLRHGDRNSMFWSVESRVPFLTSDLVELALSLRPEYLMSDRGQTKLVLRQAMTGIVPDTILSRRDKVGLATPQPSWVKELITDGLDLFRGLELVPGINKKTVTNLLLQQRNTHRESTMMWRLLNLARWAEINSNSFI